jgi:hypothetical protein
MTHSPISQIGVNPTALWSAPTEFLHAFEKSTWGASWAGVAASKYFESVWKPTIVEQADPIITLCRCSQVDKIVVSAQAQCCPADFA